MLQLQLYVNQEPFRLAEAIAEAGGHDLALTWHSPRAEDHYREYQDADFLACLRFSHFQPHLADYWPTGGPCWDGLGAWQSGPSGGPVIVEAKSYPAEAFSSMSAKSAESLRKIHGALDRTAEWLGIGARPVSWAEGRYQAANRLAHLYFLRQVCGLDALLVFVCFVDDPIHNPTSLDEWTRANEVLWSDLGLERKPPHTLVAYLPGLPRPSLA